ncbi:MAG: peptidase S9 [Geobacteraceae bacterium GWC2_58_44]|nr:MAG: peptidase S9 [Geobacteraceae bacterium GWC2_58_44]HBG07599.1 peptidase S9 [Geobacter sp.]
MRPIFIAAILLFCLSSLSHAAQFDTSFKFSTIETPNFSIHFHQGLEGVARKTAVIAEEVHGKLVKQFLWQPREKTQLVLIDDSDFTNGLAVTIPYNTIYLQVVPPSLASTLGEYDDWLKVLITHEYAHILSSDPARGYWMVTRSIFGKPLPWLDPLSGLLFLVTAPPNTFMPRWWHEGMATGAETEHTGQGRGKGSYYDMVFRTAVAEDNLPYVDQINGDVPYWPAGNLPYMFGYRLQRHITDTYGKDATGKLAIAHSGRFPYFISAPPEDLSGGKNYRGIYADMIAAVKKEQSQRIEILSKAPFTPLQELSRMGENLTNPRYSPDGSRIAFTRRDPHDHTMTVITDSTGSRVIARFRRQYSDGSICWSPDGATLYFTQAEINRGFNVYQDLYLYDISRDKTTRLTRGERLGEVEISPDGKTFAAVVSSRGSQNLALINVSEAGKGTPARLLTGYAMQRISSPRWSPDGKALSYALTDNGGRTVIRLYHLATGKDQPLFTVSHTAAFPVWSRDGSCIFYISDETGVFNLFAYDLKQLKSYQVSHLLAGALQPDPSPDGRSVAVSSYSSRGFGIAQMTLDRSTWRETRGPSLPLSRDPAAPPIPSGYVTDGMGSGVTGAADNVAVDNVAVYQGAADQGAAENAAVDVTPAGKDAAAGDTAQTASSSYSALNTVYPRFWLPRISDDGSDQAVPGAFTAGADVLGYNSYALAVDYGSERNRGYFNLIYQNDYFYPTLSVRAHAQPFLYSDLYERGDYYELNQGLTLEASVPLNFLESRYRFRAGYQLLDQKALSGLDSNDRFNGVTVFQGRRDNIFAGIGFDNVLRYPYSVSSEQGRRLSFLYRRFAREIGGDQDLSEYSAQYHEYLRLPTAALQHHVLYLRLSGALADGDLQFGQQAFQIGGVPSDLNPYPLRGYSDRSVTGKYVATGTVEYRAPLFYPLRGIGTLPAFAEKVHAAVFIDAGRVWDDRNTLAGNELRIGAGIEARADVTVGYWLKVTPALGIARGFNQGGENQLYFTVYIGL